MKTPSLSRRQFVTALPAWTSTLAFLNSRRVFAATPQPRVGCQANGFPLQPGDFPSLLAAVRTMKELDYAGFECNVRYVLEEFAHIAEARKQIEDTGVEFISAHFSMTLAKPDVLPGWVENLKALGASAIVMSGGALSKDGIFAREALLRKAAALNALGQTCRQGGLQLAYHNHNFEFANHNAEVNGLAEQTDPAFVHFLMDAGHAHLGGGDPTAFMAQHAPRIFGCHIKTYKGGEAHQVPLGQGDWGFEDLAAAIKSTGWSGWLLTEEGGGKEPPDTAAEKPDRAYIRKVFGV